jgi:hypothetical protein
MDLRGVLDPHIFILQQNAAATYLEINFNPTEEQVRALRSLHQQIRLNSA